MPMRGTFPAVCVSPAIGARTQLTARTTARPISRIGTSVEDGWRESSRRELPGGAGREGRAWLFDHLIRPQKHRLRDFHAERLGGLHVDDQLKLGRLLHWEIGGLGAFEDLVDVRRRVPPILHDARTVLHKTAFLRKAGLGRHRRYPMLQAERRNPRPDIAELGCGQREYGPRTAVHGSLECLVDIVWATGFYSLQRHADTPSRLLRRRQQRCLVGQSWIPQERNPRHTG